MDRLKEAILRIAERTKIDLENKSISDLTLSAMEELGEFSREVKIEEGIFGNRHKEADPKDGSKGEAIDLTIMGLCLFCARGGTPNEVAECLHKKIDKWTRNQERELE